MQDEQDLNPSENELMEALSGLQPVAPEITEQSLWYEAGLRAGRRGMAVWRGIAAAVVVLAIGLVTMRQQAGPAYGIRGQPVHPLPVAGTTDESVHPFRSVASVDYLRLRDAVEEHGMDALPQSSGSGVLSQPAQTAWPSQPGLPGLWDSLNAKGSL